MDQLDPKSHNPNDPVVWEEIGDKIMVTSVPYPQPSRIFFMVPHWKFAGVRTVQAPEINRILKEAGYRNGKDISGGVTCIALSLDTKTVWARRSDDGTEFRDDGMVELQWPDINVIPQWLQSTDPRDTYTRSPEAKTPSVLHTCTFINPGFGRHMWCSHDGCKETSELQ